MVEQSILSDLELFDVDESGQEFGFEESGRASPEIPLQSQALDHTRSSDGYPSPSSQKESLGGSGLHTPSRTDTSSRGERLCLLTCT